MGGYQVSSHHNIYTGREGHPLVDAQGGADTAAPAPTNKTGLDLRNNIIWNWGRFNGSALGYGTGVDFGARANIVNNFYQTSGSYSNLGAFSIEINHNESGSQVYTSGNVSGNGIDLNTYGNTSSLFSAPTVTTQAACTAAAAVRAQAGAQPRDSTDQKIVAGISLAKCPGASAGPTAPGSAALVRRSVIPLWRVERRLRERKLLTMVDTPPREAETFRTPE